MADNTNGQKLADIQSFPILTKEVGYASSPTSGGSGGGTGQLKQIAENAVRDVLGWRPKAGDTNAFLSALNQSFASTESEGTTIWTWTPRSYAVQVDMTAITGAQASIYQRAKAALDQSLPLLDGLYALDPTADPQDTEATRTIVRSALVELVNELGLVGGPRPQRVDDYFDALLDYNPDHQDPLTLTEPDSVGGQLGRLRDRFGLTRNRVNTIEEEQNLTNFFILVDYVDTLMLSWDSDREFFDRSPNSPAFLGTQQVLLLQQLAVLGESVQEAYFILESLFIGPAERQTTIIDLKDGTPPLTLAEMLEWLDHFATDEGPRLIRDGGKDGVVAIQPTLDKLLHLFRSSFALSLQPSDNPTRAFHSPRFQIVLEEITDQLRTASTQASQITRDTPDSRPADPIIRTVTPESAPNSGVTDVRIFGDDLGKVDSVTLSRKGQHSIVGVLTNVARDTVTATFDLTGEAAGDWDVTVKDPDNRSDTLPASFTIVTPAPPVIRQVHPDHALVGDKPTVRISGENFADNATAALRLGGQSIDGSPPQVIIAGTLFRTTFDLTNAAPGAWDVEVSSGGTSALLLGGYTVEAPPPPPPPEIRQISPHEAPNGGAGPTVVRILGKDFRPDVTVQLLRGNNAPINDPASPAPVAIPSGDLLTLSLDLSKAEAGTWDVQVTNKDGSADIKLDGFRVTQAPIVP